MVELTDEEFGVVYAALRAAVNMDTEGVVLDVLQAEDNAWSVMQKVATRRAMTLTSEDRDRILTRPRHQRTG